GLMQDARLNRLIEFEATAANPKDVYSASDLLTDVRNGIWSELNQASVKIDAFRRALQLSYVELMKNKVNPPTPAAPAGLPPGFSIAAPRPTDVRGLARWQLQQLNAQVSAALKKTDDQAT